MTIYKKYTSYLNMLVTSIPTNMTFTGNQTLINLHVSGSVDIRPKELSIETITTDIKFCRQKESRACKEIETVFEPIY